MSSLAQSQNSGSSSPISTNSHLRILSASFLGTGAAPSPTYTPGPLVRAGTGAAPSPTCKPEMLARAGCVTVSPPAGNPLHPLPPPADPASTWASIVQANQDFDGLAWERYDAAFRRQAAATGNRMWSRVNPSLYTLCFSACMATKRERCELCLGTTHTTQQCALQGAPDPELNSRVKTVESVLLAMAQKTSGKWWGPTQAKFAAYGTGTIAPSRCAGISTFAAPVKGPTRPSTAQGRQAQ